jgi:hypothetical protein
VGVPLKLTVAFKNVDEIPRTIKEPAVSNPFGDNVGTPELYLPAQDFGGDRFYCWKWRNDPVVDFEYAYA